MKHDSDANRALVTGGAGFIGSTVVRVGLQAGWSITVLDDLSTGFRENLPPAPGLRIVEGDIRDRDAVLEGLRGASVVFHLAAAVGNVRSIEDPAQDASVNVLGTLQVLEGMRATGVRRLVYSSSAAIFGEPKRIPVDEDHPAEPDSPYGVTKLAAEKHCLCLGRLYGWQVACLRYFNVYGVNQRYDAYGNVIPIFAQRLLNGEPLTIYGDGEQTRDFVNVDDVAEANWKVLESGQTGRFNIGSGVAMTILDLARKIQEASKRTSKIVHEPARAGEVRHSVADLARSRQSLGYRPRVDLTEGLARYMTWIAGC